MKTTIALVGLLAVLGFQETQAGDVFSLLRVSTPLVISGSAGFRAGDDALAMRPSLQVEAGIGGGRLAIGLDNTGKPGLGFGLKAAFLRTWLFPVEVDEDQMFLGIEGEISIKKLVFSLGGYRRTGDGEDDWLASAGLGFVF